MVRRWMAVLLAVASLAGAAARADEAQRILDEAGVEGGLVVSLGGDAEMLAGLRSDDPFVVQGLDADDERVAALRAELQRRGVYGPVSVKRVDGDRLPYADNLVRLLVVSDAADVPRSEMMRVLRPGGVLMCKQDGEWRKAVKPWPEGMAGWPQYFYDASNNATSEDTLVGPPESVQWWAGPCSERSHNWVNSTASMVSAGGRLFYFRDEGPIAAMPHKGNDMNWAGRVGPMPEFPEKWSLIARDAFSGVVLWKRSLYGFGNPQFEAIGPQPTIWNTWSAPLSLNRRTAATDTRVFTTLEYRGGLSALDAATGKTVWEYEPDGNVDEVVLDEEAGRLYLRVRGEIPHKPEGDVPFGREASDKSWRKTYGPEDFNEYVRSQPPEQVVALDARSGRVVWTADAPHIGVETLCAGYGKVVYHDTKALVCRDAATGEEVWRHHSEPAAQRHGWVFSRSGHFANTILWEGKVYLHGGFKENPGMTCLRLEDGSKVWYERRVSPGGSFGHPSGMRIIDGVIWNDPGNHWDAETGQGIGRLTGPLGPTHGRCHRAVATVNYLGGRAFGIEFYDLEAKEMVSDSRWLRSACAQGYLPANGMLYHTPDPCSCWLGGRIRGYHAFTSQVPDLDYDAVQPDKRLEKGPAYSMEETETNDQDWPTYRHDPLRSGRASTALSSELKQLWTADLGSPVSGLGFGYNAVHGLTPLTVAGGRIFVSRKDAHEVVCRGQLTGAVQSRRGDSSFVDTPPTVADGRVLFGCMDGYLYCLRASDGRLAWRFRAAPADTQVVHEGRPASRWPVHGAVLVRDGAVYCTAGRSSFLDGGIQLFKLDVASGELLAHGRAHGPDYGFYELNPLYEVTKDKWGNVRKVPKGYHPDFIDIEGARSDVLVSDGADLHMGATRITTDLATHSSLLDQANGETTGRRWLRTMNGFLDDTYFHRVGWHYSDQYRGGGNASGAPNAGKLVVFDDRRTYGAQWEGNFPNRYPNHVIGQGTDIVAHGLEAEASTKGFTVHPETDPVWRVNLPLIVRAMVLAPSADSVAGKLFVAGPLEKDDDPFAPYQGRGDGRLYVLSAADGRKVSEIVLPAQPVFDGMAAADGRLFMALADGRIVCFGR